MYVSIGNAFFRHALIEPIDVYVYMYMYVCRRKFRFRSLNVVLRFSYLVQLVEEVSILSRSELTSPFRNGARIFDDGIYLLSEGTDTYRRTSLFPLANFAQLGASSQPCNPSGKRMRDERPQPIIHNIRSRFFSLYACT